MKSKAQPSFNEKTALLSVVLDMELLLLNAMSVPILSTCSHQSIHLRHASQAAHNNTMRTHKRFNVRHAPMVDCHVLVQMLMSEPSAERIWNLMMKEYANVKMGTILIMRRNGIDKRAFINDRLASEVPIMIVYFAMLIIIYSQILSVRWLKQIQDAETSVLTVTIQIKLIICAILVLLNVIFEVDRSIQIDRSERKVISSNNQLMTLILVWITEKIMNGPMEIPENEMNATRPDLDV